MTEIKAHQRVHFPVQTRTGVVQVSGYVTTGRARRDGRYHVTRYMNEGTHWVRPEDMH